MEIFKKYFKANIFLWTAATCRELYLEIKRTPISRLGLSQNVPNNQVWLVKISKRMEIYLRGQSSKLERA